MINGVGDASVPINGTATINGVVYRTDDPNGVTVSGATIDGLDADAFLYVTPTGTYVVNSTTVEITDDYAARVRWRLGRATFLTFPTARNL